MTEGWKTEPNNNDCGARSLRPVVYITIPIIPIVPIIIIIIIIYVCW